MPVRFWKFNRQQGCWTHGLKQQAGADKSLARPGRKQATAAEDFDFHVSYL